VDFSESEDDDEDDDEDEDDHDDEDDDEDEDDGGNDGDEPTGAFDGVAVSQVYFNYAPDIENWNVESYG
jgi:hypothetical protein